MPLTPEQIQALRLLPIDNARANRAFDARRMLRVRQSHVAEAIGISGANLSRIENIGQNVSLDTARKLADYYGCTIEDLFPSREALAS